MDSIEDIRKRKMEQYAQESVATGAAQEQQLAQAQSEIDSLAKKYFRLKLSGVSQT